MFQITMRFLNCHKEMARYCLPATRRWRRYPKSAHRKEPAKYHKNIQNTGRSNHPAEIRPVDTGAAAKVILGTLFLSAAGPFSEDEKESGFNLLAQNVVDIILQGALLT